MHPTKVLDWIVQSYADVGTQRTIIVAILAVHKLLDLKRKEQTSYDLFLEQYDKLDAVLRDRAKDNVPTDRQRAGFVSYVELQQVRRLPVGSKESVAVMLWRLDPTPEK